MSQTAQWNPPTTLPDIPVHSRMPVNLAVLWSGATAVEVVPAYYFHAVARSLTDAPLPRGGNGWREEPSLTGGSEATGWFRFELPAWGLPLHAPLLGEGDEVKGWLPMPTWEPRAVDGVLANVAPMGSPRPVQEVAPAQTFKDLQKVVWQGVKLFYEVTSEEVEEQETCLELGMIVKVVEIHDAPDGLMRVLVNLDDYEALNKSLLKSNYFDAQGNPTLNAIDKGFYPKPGETESFYVEKDHLVSKIMKPVESPEANLYAEYVANSKGQSLLSWMAAKLQALS